MSRFAVTTGPPEDGEASPRAGRRLVRRTLVVAVLIVLVAAAAAFVTDTALGARAEQRLSRALSASPRITYQPEVTLGGFPFVVAAGRGDFSGAVITARGVRVDGCRSRGVCRAELGATLGRFRTADGADLRPDDVLSPDSLSVYTRLDSVNLGRFLGITDLTVNTPAPTGAAGAGGPQDGLLHRTTGVVLTGTVPLPPIPVDAARLRYPPSAGEYRGPKVRVSVAVDLSVADGRLRIHATGFYTGPELHVDATVPPGQRQLVLDQFSATLPTLPTPWGVTPTTARSEGSDVLLSAESGPRRVTIRDF